MEDREIYIEYRLKELEYNIGKLHRVFWGAIFGMLIYIQGYFVYNQLFRTRFLEIVFSTLIVAGLLIYTIKSTQTDIKSLENDLKEELGEEYGNKI